MAPPAFVGSNSAQSSATTCVVNKPGGGTLTDVMFACWAVTGVVADATMTLPTGWVKLGYYAPAGGPTTKIAYKLVSSSGEPATYTFTLGTAAVQSAMVARWSNIDTTQVADAYVSFLGNTGNSAAPVA